MVEWLDAGGEGLHEGEAIREGRCGGVLLLLGGGILGDGTLELLACQEEGREVPQSSCSGAIEDTVEEIVLEAGSCEGPKML